MNTKTSNKMGRKERESTSTTKFFADWLSDKLNEYKVDKNKTLLDVAHEMGVPSGSLSNWANDKTTININDLYKVCKYFNVSADYLLTLSLSESPQINDKAISKEIGLSDKSIRVLSYLNKYNKPSTWNDTTTQNHMTLDFINRMLSFLYDQKPALYSTKTESDNLIFSIFAEMEKYIRTNNENTKLYFKETLLEEYTLLKIDKAIQQRQTDKDLDIQKVQNSINQEIEKLTHHVCFDTAVGMSMRTPADVYKSEILENIRMELNYFNDIENKKNGGKK